MEECRVRTAALAPGWRRSWPQGFGPVVQAAGAQVLASLFGLSGMACTAAGQLFRETQPAPVMRRLQPMGTACSPCFQGLTSLLLLSREGKRRFQAREGRGEHVNMNTAFSSGKARSPIAASLPCEIGGGALPALHDQGPPKNICRKSQPGLVRPLRGASRLVAHGT